MRHGHVIIVTLDAGKPEPREASHHDPVSRHDKRWHGELEDSAENQPSSELAVWTHPICDWPHSFTWASHVEARKYPSTAFAGIPALPR